MIWKKVICDQEMKNLGRFTMICGSYRGIWFRDAQASLAEPEQISNLHKMVANPPHSSFMTSTSPQSTMVCQTSSNNLCPFVKIGPNILLSASVWLPVLFSRILRRWYGPTAMICDSYLKNQSAGCYWHHKWTREQAGDPEMENLLIETHSKSGFSQLYIWVDSCLPVISMSLNLVSADFHQTFGVCL